MIQLFHVQNYKALRDVSLELTPVHALIGPNDAGKTSILFALAALSRSVDFELSEAFLGNWEGRELVWHGSTENDVTFQASLKDGPLEFEYTLACRFPDAGREVQVQREMVNLAKQIELEQVTGHSFARRIAARKEPACDERIRACHQVHAALSGVQYYRWNPRVLALPVAPDAAHHFQMNWDGFGLAMLLDDILGHDRKLFGELEDKFRKCFPEIGSIQLVRKPGHRVPPDYLDQAPKTELAEGKGIHFLLRSTKQSVPASQVSDGALLVLAYLAVVHSPKRPRLLLIEEPENGIHPKRLQDVIALLRDMTGGSSPTQVVFTTHSPYAVDYLKPEEVTLCTKHDGTGEVIVTKLADVPSVKEQLAIFHLGEIWTAEGDASLANQARPRADAAEPAGTSRP